MLTRMLEPEASERAKAARVAPLRRGPPIAGAGTNVGMGRILELQRLAGNRAIAQALGRAQGPQVPVIQRLDWEDAVDFLQWTNPLTLGGKALREFTGVELNMWAAAEQAIRKSATKVAIPPEFVTVLRNYAAYNPADGAILKNALAQGPSHYTGGWLIGGNEDAAAITFGNSVFYNAAPKVEDYIHELVHINQYRVLGRKAFVLSYFGMSAATILKRLMLGQPVKAMRSSPHEEQAYQLEERFKEWRSRNP